MQEFLSSIHSLYQAKLGTVDFISACEAARKEINKWVSEQTKGQYVAYFISYVRFILTDGEASAHQALKIKYLVTILPAIPSTGQGSYLRSEQAEFFDAWTQKCAGYSLR